MRNFFSTSSSYSPFLLSSSLAEGKSTLLLYSTDLSSDNLISIQLDSITLNQIIADSEKQGRIVKKINFRDLTKLNELLNGKSTKFSYSDDAANSVCDISCNANCKVTTTTTPRRPGPFVSTKDTVTGPPYLPPVSVSRKDEVITIPTTTTTTLRPVTTTSQRISTRTETPRTTTTTTTTTRRPIVSSTVEEYIKPTTLRGTTTTTTTTRRPTTTTPRRPSKSTPGPAYLPLATKTTFRPVTVSSGTTYPPATWPRYSTQYTSVFPTWTGAVRRFTYEPKSTTTTARYEYNQPSNSLTYGAEQIDVRSLDP